MHSDWNEKRIKSTFRLPKGTLAHTFKGIWQGGKFPYSISIVFSVVVSVQMQSV